MRHRRAGEGFVMAAAVVGLLCPKPVPAETMKWAINNSEASVLFEEQGGLREYTLRSSAELRDNNPPEQQVVFSEERNRARLRTGNTMFDALHALAVHEVLENSVPEIRDYAYQSGEAIPIEAFQTGEKWTYVWTRDLAYSVHLSLAGFDPQRSISSLMFKTSSLKPSVSGGYGQQIIQDTGSGGSYPVSTDRVVWALGAWETVKNLSGPDRDRFLRRIYPILHDTIEQDRILVYDPRDGLYRGEQSFLDWREQSYPGWTREDVLPIALSKSLSVNVLNYHLLTVASRCAEHLDRINESERYAAWAGGLKTAINAAFYDPEVSQYCAYLLSDGHCSIRAKRFDLLGESLAVLTGVADADRAAAVVSGYPVGPHGPPVVWPQERMVPIYHNQGIWPFVTAYWIKAARQTDNAAAVNHGVQTLMRLTALNLSNMENYDFVSGRAEVKDQALTGPVVNSRRQLWSVAGYLSVVRDVIFGLQTSLDGIRFDPYVTGALRRDLFASAEMIEMINLGYCGTRHTVRIHLPPAGEPVEGAYAVERVVLNGKVLNQRYAAIRDMKQDNVWEIYLKAPDAAGQGSLTWVDVTDEQLLYGPVQPRWAAEEQGAITVDNGLIRLRFSHPDKDHVVFNIYRDGEQVAKGIRQTSWVDEGSADYKETAYCYAIEAEDPSNGNVSHLTAFRCYTPAVIQHVIPASGLKNRGGRLVDAHHFEEWGTSGDELVSEPFGVDKPGRYTIRTRFSNGSGPVNTGITCGVKAMQILERVSGSVVAAGYLIMPQSGDWNRWDLSSPVLADLDAGKEYRVRIYEDEFARNMSYLEQNECYTVWPGGGRDGYNYVNIAAVQLDRVSAGGGEVPGMVSGNRLTQRGENQ